MAKTDDQKPAADQPEGSNEQEPTDKPLTPINVHYNRVFESIKGTGGRTDNTERTDKDED